MFDYEKAVEAFVLTQKTQGTYGLIDNKKDILRQISNVLFPNNTKRPSYENSLRLQNQVTYLNIELIESCMPYEDEAVQRRAIRTIENLQKTLL